MPLDREFGIDLSLLDLPIEIARVKLLRAMAGAIERYEPRAKLLSAAFEQAGAINGTLSVKLALEVTA